MDSQPKHNYVRTYRRRLGLSQDDVAYLLDAGLGTTVSRHESGARIPTLETALAYEAILATPLHEIFADQFQKIQGEVRIRSKELLKAISDKATTPLLSQKLETLSALTKCEDVITIPLWN